MDLIIHRPGASKLYGWHGDKPEIVKPLETCYIGDMKSKVIASSFLFILLSFYPPAHAGRNDVESSQRLGLLQQATGSGGSSGFQAQLNAVLSPSAQPDQAVILHQDAEARLEAKQTEADLLLEGLGPSTEDEEKKDEFAQRDKTREKTQDQNQINATEKAYLKSVRDLQEEDQERRQKAEAGQDALVTDREAASSKTDSGSQNPFYFGPAPVSIREKKFEENRPVIIERLIADGLAEEDAKALVAEVSNAEELILKLMQEENMTFGKASEIASAE